MPSLNGSQATLATELGTQMISMIGSFMETIHATPASPISSFPTKNSGNYVFVIYTNGGHPLTIGVITESMRAEEIAQIVSNVRSLGAAGVAASQRIIDAGTASVAVNLHRIIQGLLTVETRVSTPAPTASAAAPAATKKRRGPKKKAASAPKKGQRGRPKKNADAAPAAPAADAPKKGQRGRPKKNADAAPAAPATDAPKKGQRGRPKKNADAAPAVPAADAPKKGQRGRPKKNADAAPAVPAADAAAPVAVETPVAETAHATRPAPKPRGGGKKRKVTAAKGKGGKRGAKKKSATPASAEPSTEG